MKVNIGTWLVRIHLIFFMAMAVSTGSASAQKIVVLLSYDTGAAEYSESVQRGVRTALAADSTTVAVSTTATTETFTYSAGNGVTVEVQKICVGEATCVTEMTTAFVAATNDTDVVAIVCAGSSDCNNATNSSAQTDVLVAAVVATSTYLSSATNMLLVAPSNRYQSQAIYDDMKSDSIGNYAIVFEPDTYAGDLQVNQLSAAMSDQMIATSETTGLPTLLASVPVYDNITGVARLKAMSISTAVDVVAGLSSLDTIVYFGGSTSFATLFAAVNAKAGLSITKWYGGDSVWSSSIASISGIESVTFKTYVPAGRDTSTAASTTFETAYDAMFGAGDTIYRPAFDVDYGYDTGNYLKAVITSLSTAGSTINRANFLESATATDTTITGLTGTKKFDTSAIEKKFDVYTITGAAWSKSKTVTVAAEEEIR